MLVILLDDVGFGASSAFGGPCATPNAERLAAGGLKFNRFHTTALCAPTRQALLTGRNHHSVGMGSITETATSAPGNSSLRPNTKAPLAMTLKLNGYSTAQFGKCHEVPVWQSSPMGPFDAWPSGGGGFETFYGFIGGENNQWEPALYDGTTPVEPPATPEEGYHLTEDLADHAIGWIRSQKALMPDKPFFVYFAPGATHAPAPRAQGVGRQVRREVRRRLGRAARAARSPGRRNSASSRPTPSSPRGTPRSPRGTTCPPSSSPCSSARWRSTPGSSSTPTITSAASSTPIEDLGVLENTLIYYIIGDNGASAEGTLNGAFNEMANFNGMAALETPEFMTSKLDELGSPSSYNHYAVGWAWAMDTPFQWTKQVASHWGGTRNGTIVHWPNGIDEQGGLRTQFTHCIDVAPTILEAAGLPEPTMVNGVQQSPMEGTSMLVLVPRTRGPRASRPAVLRDVRQPRRLLQGLERRHQAPHAVGDGRRRRCRRSTTTSGSSTTATSTTARPATSSAEQPDRLHELQRLWLIEAVKYNVLPIDDRTARATQSRARRPADAHPRQQPAVLRGHGPTLREQRREHQEQVVLGHGRGRGSRWRRRAA